MWGGVNKSPADKTSQLCQERRIKGTRGDAGVAMPAWRCRRGDAGVAMPAFRRGPGEGSPCVCRHAAGTAPDEVGIGSEARESERGSEDEEEVQQIKV